MIVPTKSNATPEYKENLIAILVKEKACDGYRNIRAVSDRAPIPQLRSVIYGLILLYIYTNFFGAVSKMPSTSICIVSKEKK